MAGSRYARWHVSGSAQWRPLLKSITAFVATLTNSPYNAKYKPSNAGSNACRAFKTLGHSQGSARLDSRNFSLPSRALRSGWELADEVKVQKACSRLSLKPSKRTGPTFFWRAWAALESA